MILQRFAYNSRGIFGQLLDEEGSAICRTLEHAFPAGSSWAPALPAGEYKCVRGKHRLHRTSPAFETFEVQNVPRHTGILFHKGNFNEDSKGCILVGKAYFPNDSNPAGLTHSIDAFSKFMSCLDGVDEFQLLVR